MSSTSNNIPTSLDIDGSFEHILKSNNADKECEFFWLTFKTSIIKFVGIQLKKVIITLSEELNNLQKDKKYEDIKSHITSFMNNHIEDVIICILKSLDCVSISHLRTNISRWEKIDRNFKCNSINYDVLIVVKNLSFRNNNVYKNFLEIYREYLNTNDTDKLYTIVSNSIESNTPSILNIFKDSVDISVFVKDNCEKNIQTLLSMNSVKLIKYLKPLSAKNN